MVRDLAIELTDQDVQVAEVFRQRERVAVLVIMFTDIDGSTQLLEAVGEKEYAKIRRHHDEIVRSTVEHESGGCCIKQLGDGFMSLFTEPSTAVERCLQIHEFLRCSSVLKIRIGLDMGQIAIERAGGITRDAFGRFVNRASRIMAAASGGQTLASYHVWDSAVGWLSASDVGWRTLGELQVKGFANPVRVYEFYSLTKSAQSIAAGQRQEAPHPVVAGVTPTLLEAPEKDSRSLPPSPEPSAPPSARPLTKDTTEMASSPRVARIMRGVRVSLIAALSLLVAVGALTTMLRRSHKPMSPAPAQVPLPSTSMPPSQPMAPVPMPDLSIDQGTPERAESKAGSRPTQVEFQLLERRFNEAKRLGDEAALLELQGEFGRMARKAAPQARRAKEIAEIEIPAELSRIREQSEARSKAAQIEAQRRFEQLEDRFRQAGREGDLRELRQLQVQFDGIAKTTAPQALRAGEIAEKEIPEALRRTSLRRILKWTCGSALVLAAAIVFFLKVRRRRQPLRLLWLDSRPEKTSFARRLLVDAGRQLHAASGAAKVVTLLLLNKYDMLVVAVESEREGNRRLRLLRRISPLARRVAVVFFANLQTAQKVAASELKIPGSRCTASVEELTELAASFCRETR
ncbi:MAG TPA: adenylate/guanylate cyclase domain-containing protein [Acidobacteriota bacterium]|nr:adenylate/guanylate cyclase domain-containing protein [Acidobacteriota bacterium]